MKESKAYCSCIRGLKALHPEKSHGRVEHDEANGIEFSINVFFITELNKGEDTCKYCNYIAVQTDDTEKLEASYWIEERYNNGKKDVADYLDDNSLFDIDNDDVLDDDFEVG